MILITGAAGFIGSNLVATFNDGGRSDLILCDWLKQDGRWENLAKRSFADFVLPEDIEGALATYENAIDLVIHMGAISDTTACDGDRVIRQNYQFTRRLWSWCARAGKTFIYASSAATYGDGSSGFEDRLDIGRLRRLRPLNLYGWSKHVFDLYVCDTPAEAPPHWYGLKFFNVFGPNEYHKDAMRSLLCKSAVGIAAGQTSQLFRSYHPDFADGGQMRDFIYVDDACTVVQHFAKGTSPSGLYNVGTGEPRSFRDLIAAGYLAVGREPAIRYVDMPEAIRERYQYFTSAQTTKLRRSGFNKAFPLLEHTAARYMHDYLLQPDRYR